MSVLKFAWGHHSVMAARGGVGFVMEEDVPPDPVNLRLLATVGVTLEPDCVTDSIEQFLVS